MMTTTETRMTAEELQRRTKYRLYSDTLELRDDSGESHEVTIEAADDSAAIQAARDNVQSHADDWCSDGEWGSDGAAIPVSWTLTDADGEELDSGCVTVEIEPDHESLIADAVPSWDRGEDFCGLAPDDHDWTSEGEGGCDQNPGVWSTGGTSMVFKSHCRRCGLQRTETSTGSQRNPGEHDTVTYEMPIGESDA